MAGVNNPPNLKPLIDSQSTELTAAAQAISAKVEVAKVSLEAEANKTKQAVNDASNVIRNFIAQSVIDSEAATNKARDTVINELTQQVKTLTGAVNSAPKSPIKSIQRGASFVSGSGTLNNISVSEVDISKVVLNANGCYGNSIYVVDSVTIATRSQSNRASLISWELIEYA